MGETQASHNWRGNEAFSKPRPFRDEAIDEVQFGIVVFPGGFGTLDEMFEVLTLVQTHKVKKVPVVLFGSEYWKGLLDWMNGPVLGAGMIAPLDKSIIHVTDDIDEAVEVALSGIMASREG